MTNFLKMDMSFVDEVVHSIIKIKKQKQRPNTERIFTMISKSHPELTLGILMENIELAIKEGLVVNHLHNGVYSYRVVPTNTSRSNKKYIDDKSIEDAVKLIFSNNTNEYSVEMLEMLVKKQFCSGSLYNSNLQIVINNTCSELIELGKLIQHKGFYRKIEETNKTNSYARPNNHKHCRIDAEGSESSKVSFLVSKENDISQDITTHLLPPESSINFNNSSESCLDKTHAAERYKTNHDSLSDNEAIAADVCSKQIDGTRHHPLANINDSNTDNNKVNVCGANKGKKSRNPQLSFLYDSLTKFFSVTNYRRSCTNEKTYNEDQLYKNSLSKTVSSYPVHNEDKKKVKSTKLSSSKLKRKVELSNLLEESNDKRSCEDVETANRLIVHKTIIKQKVKRKTVVKKRKVLEEKILPLSSPLSFSSTSYSSPAPSSSNSLNPPSTDVNVYHGHVVECHPRINLDEVDCNEINLASITEHDENMFLRSNVPLATCTRPSVGVAFGRFLLTSTNTTSVEEMRQKKLVICEFCLAIVESNKCLERHVMKCGQHCPPGIEIFRESDIKLFHVQSQQQPTYCKQLERLLQILFIVDHSATKHKIADADSVMVDNQNDGSTLGTDIDNQKNSDALDQINISINNKSHAKKFSENINYFLLTIQDRSGSHLAGILSYDCQHEGKWMVSCLFVLPQYRNQGHAKCLLNLVYHLASIQKRETVVHVTERLKNTVYNLLLTVWKNVLVEHFIGSKELQFNVEELMKSCSINQSDILLAFENMKLESEFQFNKAKIIMTEEQKCDMKRCLLANNASSSNPSIPFKKLSFRDANCITSSSLHGHLIENEADQDNEDRDDDDDCHNYNKTSMKLDYKKRHNIYKRPGNDDNHPCNPPDLLERMLHHAYYKTNEKASSEQDIGEADVDKKVCDRTEDSSMDGNGGKQAASPPNINSNNTLERKRKSSNEKLKDDNNMDASVVDDDDMFNNEIKKICVEERRDNDVCDDVIMDDHAGVTVDHNEAMDDDNIDASSDHNITDDPQMKNQHIYHPDCSPNNIYNEENTDAPKNPNKTSDPNNITNDSLASNIVTKQNASNKSPVITEPLNNKPPQTTQSFDSDMPSLDESSFWMDGVVVTPSTAASSVGVTSLSPSPPDLKKENPNSEHSVIKYDAGVELSVRSDQSELDVGGPTAYSPIKNQNSFPNSMRNTSQEIEDEQWSNSVKNNSEDDDCTVVAVERAAGSVSATTLKCASHTIQPSNISSCQRNDRTVVDRNSFSYPYFAQQQEAQLPILPFPVYRNIINDNNHPVGDVMMNRHLHNLQQPQKPVYKNQNPHAPSTEYCSNDAYMKKSNYSPEDVVNARPLDNTNFSRQCQSVAPSVGGAIQKSNRAKKSSKMINEVNANDVAKNSGNFSQERCSSVFSDVHTGSQYNNQTIFNGNQMMTQHQLASNEVGHHSRSAIYHDLMNHNRPATRCGLETTTFSQHQQFTSSNFPTGMSESQRLLHLNNNNSNNNNNHSNNNRSNISSSLLYLNNTSNGNNNNVINNPNSQIISQMECMISNNNKVMPSSSNFQSIQTQSIENNDNQQNHSSHHPQQSSLHQLQQSHQNSLPITKSNKKSINKSSNFKSSSSYQINTADAVQQPSSEQFFNAFYNLPNVSQNLDLPNSGCYGGGSSERCSRNSNFLSPNSINQIGYFNQPQSSPPNTKHQSRASNCGLLQPGNQSLQHSHNVASRTSNNNTSNLNNINNNLSNNDGNLHHSHLQLAQQSNDIIHQQHDLLLQQQRQQQAAYLNPAAYFAKLHQFHSEFTHPLQYSSFFTHSTSPSPIDMTLHLPAPRPANIGARKNASSSLSLQQQHQQHQHTRESMMSNVDVLPPYKVANFNPYAGGSVVVDPRNLIQGSNPAAIFNQQQNVASSMLPESLNNNNNNNNNNNKQSDLPQQSNYPSYSNGSVRSSSHNFNGQIK